VGAIAVQETGAGEAAVGAMEMVSSFKHGEVFKKMNFIFAGVGSGGCGGGGVEEEDEFLAPIIFFFSLAYIQSSSYVRNFLFSLRLKFVATYFLHDLCNN